MSLTLYPVPLDENFEDGMTQPSVVINTNARRAEVVALPVIDFAAAEPVTPVDGDLYVVSTPWLTGSVDDLAYFYDGAWTFWAPYEQLLKTIAGVEYVFASSAWVTVMSTLGNYVDDTAAAIGLVPVGGEYRNGSVRMWRVA